ncbi:hypothetical protein FOZ60_007680 [Perkinsus olseni]|uniref:Uncharacterized protein n=1 Tax=Perkinsus olseni TaxID=32597 RepID=A0A7J6NL60_PEROL|nr:hypothetical protein FOZ60_007680 [Perkinsus olseni]
MGALQSKILSPFLFIVPSALSSHTYVGPDRAYLNWKPPVGYYRSNVTGIDGLVEVSVEVTMDNRNLLASFGFLSADGNMTTTPLNQLVRVIEGGLLSRRNCRELRYRPWAWQSTPVRLRKVTSDTIAVCPPTRTEDFASVLRVVLYKQSYGTQLPMVVEVHRTNDASHSLAPPRRLIYPGIYVNDSSQENGVGKLRVVIRTEAPAAVDGASYVRFEVFCVSVGFSDSDGGDYKGVTVDEVLGMLGGYRSSIAICPTSSEDTLSIVLNKDSWGTDEIFFLLLGSSGRRMSDSEVARCGWAGRYTGANKEDYVRAFKDFDVETLVRQASEATSIDELVDAVVEGDFDVVRSRRKIESVYRNAEAARTVQGEYGSLCEYIWHFTEGRQIVNTWKSVHDIPSHTELSERVAKDMKARGFRMVGSDDGVLLAAGGGSRERPLGSTMQLLPLELAGMAERMARYAHLAEAEAAKRVMLLGLPGGGYPNPLTGPSSPFDDPSIMQALPGGSPKYPYVGPRFSRLEMLLPPKSPAEWEGWVGEASRRRRAPPKGREDILEVLGGQCEKNRRQC